MGITFYCSVCTWLATCLLFQGSCTPRLCLWAPLTAPHNLGTLSLLLLALEFRLPLKYCELRPSSPRPRLLCFRSPSLANSRSRAAFLHPDASWSSGPASPCPHFFPWAAKTSCFPKCCSSGLSQVPALLKWAQTPLAWRGRTVLPLELLEV